MPGILSELMTLHRWQALVDCGLLVPALLYLSALSHTSIEDHDIVILSELVVMTLGLRHPVVLQ